MRWFRVGVRVGVSVRVTVRVGVIASVTRVVQPELRLAQHLGSG